MKTLALAFKAFFSIIFKRKYLFCDYRTVFYNKSNTTDFINLSNGLNQTVNEIIVQHKLIEEAKEIISK